MGRDFSEQHWHWLWSHPTKYTVAIRMQSLGLKSSQHGILSIGAPVLRVCGIIPQLPCMSS